MTAAKRMPVFDLPAHLRNRDRAAAGYGGYGFLKKTVAANMVERLDVVRRRFDRVADIGCHDGELALALAAHERVGEVVAVDPSAAMTALAAARTKGNPAITAMTAPYDALPFRDGSLDAVFSCLALHWVEDLSGMLARLARLLKPDGLLLVALPGGETLTALRASLTEAESRVCGGVSPRVMPMADIRDLGGLLGRAGLALPVADCERLRITYPDAFALMRDLRGMGESGALHGRVRHFTRREVFTAMAEIMADKAGDGDGRIEEAFEIITLTGWTPHPRQQKPLAPGTGKVALGDAF